MEEGAKWEEEARNTDGQTDLHLAVVENRVDNVVKLLHEGADINAVDNNCQTPLHLAATFKHYDIAMVLLQQSDIDVEKVSTEGEHPFLNFEVSTININ
jgi:ankyrin repeat protein